MIIKKIELQNFQCIDKFDADFEGNVYFVTGDNEFGKSTLLKAIGALLTGERDAVLQNGKDKGFAKMVVGNDGKEYGVTLSYTKANPRGTLTITSPEGEKSNNLSTLQKLFGYTDYDAVEFSRWSETAEGRRKQIAVVKSLLPEKVVKRIAKIDQEVADIKDERYNVNLNIKTCETLCREIELPSNWREYTGNISIGELLVEKEKQLQLDANAQKIREALELRTKQLGMIPERIDAAEEEKKSKLNDIAEERKQALKEYERRLHELQQDEEDAEKEYNAQLEEIEADKADFERRKENAENWLSKYEEIKTNKNIEEELARAEEHNKIYNDVIKYKDRQNKLEEAKREKQKCENKLKALADERAKLIGNSELPIKGLTFTDDGLELNGVPFVAGKVSDSQIMEVAAKLIIASNPTVKVFRIARGESLGEKRLRAIIDIARANGFQGFIEEVRRGQSELIVEEYTENEQTSQYGRFVRREV